MSTEPERDMRNPSEVMDEPWIWADAPDRGEPDGKAGTWMVFAPLEESDAIWARIRDAVHRGDLGQAAKAATSPGRQGGRAIMVYSLDANDLEDVRRVLCGLRDLGFSERLSYKADEVTRELRYGKGVSWYVSQPGSRDFDDRRPRPPQEGLF